MLHQCLIWASLPADRALYISYCIQGFVYIIMYTGFVYIIMYTGLCIYHNGWGVLLYQLSVHWVAPVQSLACVALGCFTSQVSGQRQVHLKHTAVVDPPGIEQQ